MESWEKKYWDQVNKNRSTSSTPTLPGRMDKVSPAPQRVSGAVATTVAPGVRFYRLLQTGGFGSTVPLLKEEGVVSDDMARREYVERGNVRGFPVDQDVIVDLAYVSIDNPKIREFRCLEAPFVGKIYVPVAPVRTLLKG